MKGIVENFANCMLEGVSLLLLWGLFESYIPKKAELIRTLIAFAVSALAIIWLEFSGLILLPLNFLLIFVSFKIGFYRVKTTKVFANTLSAYLIMIDAQVFFVCLLPQDWFNSSLGYFAGNLLTLFCATGLTFLSKRNHWCEFYKSNSKVIWLCIIVLCVPSIVTAQIATIWLGETSRSTLTILLLSQLLYLSSVIVIFLLNNRKNEKRELETTHKLIAELNVHLDDSRQHIHDFNKHLRFLRNAVITHSENETLTEIVNGYCEDLVAIYDEEEILLQLDSPIFRALLYGRRTQAIHNNIQFHLNATSLLPNFPVTNYQLVEVFDNIMDNAFECVMDLPQEKRWIRATLSTFPQNHGKTLHEFCVENPYEELDISAVLNEGAYSSKKGHKGIGLQRVSHLVSNTGGKLILSTQKGIQGDTFVIKIQYTNSPENLDK